VEALTVLVGLSALVVPALESWLLSTSLETTGVTSGVVCDVWDDSVGDDAGPASVASDSAAATPLPAPSAMPAPATTIHNPRSIFFDVTAGL
jgi:hypothetical protein